MKKQTDDLVKRAKRHESEAFTELMQLYMTDMYKVAYAILMNDEDAAGCNRRYDSDMLGKNDPISEDTVF